MLRQAGTQGMTLTTAAGPDSTDVTRWTRGAAVSGKPQVVIIGAGVGGLTLALLLRQRGIAAEVLEQSAELGEVGAAVSLAANATRVLHDLGLGEALARVSTEPTALIHRDGRDGRQIAVTPGPWWYRDTF